MNHLLLCAAASSTLFGLSSSAAVIASTGFDGIPGELGIASETFLSASGPSPVVGVQSFAAALSSPNAYLIQDTDADYELLLDSVDLTDFTSVEVTLFWRAENPSGNFSGNDDLLIEAIWSDGVSSNSIVLFEEPTGAKTNIEAGIGLWNEVSTPIPDSAVSVQVRVVGNTSSDPEQLYIDNVSITGIPEPASLALVSLGLVALTARTRTLD